MRKFVLLIICSWIVFAACGPSSKRQQAEALCQRAYNFKYANVDTVQALATEALCLSSHCQEEALNLLAYVEYQRMNFAAVDSLLALGKTGSRDQISLLGADVMQMKSCQRTGDGLRFFQAKSSAEKRIHRIVDEEKWLSDYDRRRFISAQSEYHLISSTYYYYQEQDSLAKAELDALTPLDLERTDTTQWIYTLYMMGSGGMLILLGDELILAEFDYAIQTYYLSYETSNLYFLGNALQTLAVQLAKHKDLLLQERPGAVRMLEARYATADDSDLPPLLCDEAIRLFEEYGDLFQKACCWRTHGEICFIEGDYKHALDDYTKALHCVNEHHQRYYGNDTLLLYDPSLTGQSTEMRWLANDTIFTVPEWIAGIRQQLSLAFSALNMKAESDFNHNAYLDLLVMVGQNRELENRSQELHDEAQQLRIKIFIALFLVAALLVLVYIYRRRLRYRSHLLKQEFDDLKTNASPDFLKSLEEECTEAQESLTVSLMRLADNKRHNAEKRAKVQLVHDIVPYLDRIGGEVIRMTKSGRVETERREYICELISRIEEYNDVLTEWIKMQQGQHSLRITTISLHNLFNIISQGSYAFNQKGVTLQVEDTQAYVKGDESLTLFMINTLAENARKFTPNGGNVTVRAAEMDNYVEVQVQDTGCGLSEEDVDTLNHSKVYDPSTIGNGGEKGFGFGLMNCRGIIEKYKKHSSLFDCCQFGVRSTLGKGSTFFFRLPHVLMLLALSCFFTKVTTAALTPYELYDSVYQCNVEGRYSDAIRHGQQAIEEAFRQDSVDYTLIVGIRNELSLAALALHDWDLYKYNIKRCTRLYKQLNQDPELPDYSRNMERLRDNSRAMLVAIFLIAFLMLVVIYRMLLLRQLKVGEDIEHQIIERKEELLRAKQSDLQQIQDALSKAKYEEGRLHVQNQILDNCLSTIKHESMYYPARIYQLCDKMQDEDIPQLAELVSFYHHVYTILSRQADEEVEKPYIRLQDLSDEEMNTILRRSHQRAYRKAGLEAQLTIGSLPQSVRADSTMFETLADMLFSTQLLQCSHIKIRTHESGKQCFLSFIFFGIFLDEQQRHDLFYPAVERIPLLVVKQIIREHDIRCNNPGLRLYADVTEEGSLEINFSLQNSRRTNTV
ncbi:MAG: DUF5113 domain-containing protein [Bacteroidaceae bacterium]|nr:DUF5113 domain-containing protein [Bacteroidaceae bacterium]